MPTKIAPDATHGSKLLRLFIRLLLDGGKHFQTDLARILECSPQTIIRLTAAIEAVVGDSLEIGTEERKRYYRIRNFSAKRAFGLDYEELRYLGVCRDLASGMLPSEAVNRIDSTISSLAIMLAEQGQATRPGEKQQVWFNPKGYIDYTKQQRVFDQLMDAIDKSQVCLVEYKASSKRPSRVHRHAPIRLTYMNSAFYVLGYIVDEDDNQPIKPTNLALHRIIRVNFTSQIHECKPEKHDLNYFGLKWHEPKTFRIRFTEKVATYIRERTWSSRQEVFEQEDGGVILELDVVSEPELSSWVMSFGPEATFVK